MPTALWHRQIARQTGLSLSVARALGAEPPKGKPKRPAPIFYLPWSGEYLPVELGQF